VKVRSASRSSRARGTSWELSAVLTASLGLTAAMVAATAFAASPAPARSPVGGTWTTASPKSKAAAKATAAAKPAASPSGSAPSAVPIDALPSAVPVAATTPPATPTPRYSLTYDVRIVPTEKTAHVVVQTQDPGALLKSVDLRIDPERHFEFSGDGTVEVRGDRVLWQPPARGGKLRYRFRIDHLRDERSYDSRIRDSWAIFRGDDLVPPARVRTTKGAQADSRLRLRVPEGWSVVAPYERREDGTFAIDDPERRFDRPFGWIAVGHLGVVRETIADTRVAIAGPRGQSFRRQDLLALLRWTLPTLRQIVPTLPPRIVVVGAGDPMWRGGLSGPSSLFLHSDRPSISEDGTSPLLHELVHVALRAPSGPGGDWVVEGLAELYSLELLARSGTLSRKRYERALQRFEEKGRTAKSLRSEPAGPAERARAVTVLRELDAQLDENTGGRVRLDQVFRELARSRGPVTTEALREAAERASGSNLETFFARPELAPGSGT
jgi:hypothetical protein